MEWDSPPTTVCEKFPCRVTNGRAAPHRPVSRLWDHPDEQEAASLAGLWDGAGCDDRGCPRPRAVNQVLYDRLRLVLPGWLPFHYPDSL